jgi:hypothetical protein
MHLTAAERREAAALHVGALVETLPSHAVGASVHFGAVSAELIETREGGDISYQDLGIGFHIEGLTLSFNDGPTTMAALLELLHYGRDRSDVLLYLPAEVRSERIRALAQRTGSSERFVRYLLAHAPAIERKLAA